jgi:hypothetical protein
MRAALDSGEFLMRSAQGSAPDFARSPPLRGGWRLREAVGSGGLRSRPHHYPSLLGSPRSSPLRTRFLFPATSTAGETQCRTGASINAQPRYPRIPRTKHGIAPGRGLLFVSRQYGKRPPPPRRPALTVSGGAGVADSPRPSATTASTRYRARSTAHTLAFWESGMSR